MKDNTITSSEGIEVYTSRIQELADDYIYNVLDGDTELIKKPNSDQFSGLIHHIVLNINYEPYIYNSVDILESIWNEYLKLVYKYNQNPTIEEYAILIDKSRSVIYEWINGTVKRELRSEKTNLSLSDTMKKWNDLCKMGRYKSAARGNVGGIFLCKAVDGMAETAPVQIQQPIIQQKTPEQIAAEYGEVVQIAENENILHLPPTD